MTHQIDYQGTPEATSDEMERLGFIAEAQPKTYDTLSPEFQQKANEWLDAMSDDPNGDFVSARDVWLFEVIVAELHQEQARLDARLTLMSEALHKADTDLEWVKPPEDEDRLVAQDNARRKDL